MPDISTIGSLVVEIRAKDAKETTKQIKEVQETTKKAGQESKRQIPVLEKMGRRWGAVLTMVAASGALAFGLIAKSSPSVLGALKGMQLAFEDIFGLIGEELAPVFEYLEEILYKVADAFAALSPETRSLIAGLTLAVIVLGAVSIAVVGLVAIWPLLTAAVAAVVAAVGISIGWIGVIIAGLVLAVGFLFTAWKHNWGGIQDKTVAVVQFIKDVIGRFTSWVSERWTTFLGIIFDKNLNTYGKLKAIWGFLKETLAQIMTTITKEMANAWEHIKNISIWIWEQIKIAIPVILRVLNSIMSAIWDDIKASAAEAWEDIKTVILNKVASITGIAPERLREMSNDIFTIWNGIKDNATDGWNNIKLAILRPVLSITELALVFLKSFKTSVASVWSGIKGNTMSAWRGLKNTIIRYVYSTVNEVPALLNTLKTKMFNVWINIKEDVLKVWTFIKNVITTKIKGAYDYVVGKIDGLKSLFSGLSFNLLFDGTSSKEASGSSTGMSGINLNDSKSKSKSSSSSRKSTISKVSSAVKSVASAASSVTKSVVSKVKSVISKVKSAVKSVASKVKSVVSKVSSGVKSVASKVGSFFKRRQFGGPVSAGDPYVVGEAGPELFVPNVSGTVLPNNKTDTKSQGTAATPPSRPININLDLKLDGRTVWESVSKYSAAEIRRLGG